MSSNVNNFIEELRLAYNNILDLRKHLDGKASTMIATSGTVSSLLFGFGTFTLTRITPVYPFLPYAVVTLIAAVVVTAISALISLRAFETGKYDYVMSHSRFFRGGRLNEKVVRGYREAKPESFQKNMIDDYLQCNRINNEINNNKVRKISRAQNFLLFRILLTPLVLAMLFINQIDMVVVHLLHLLGL